MHSKKHRVGRPAARGRLGRAAEERACLVDPVVGRRHV